MIRQRTDWDVENMLDVVIIAIQSGTISGANGNVIVIARRQSTSLFILQIATAIHLIMTGYLIRTCLYCFLLDICISFSRNAVVCGLAVSNDEVEEFLVIIESN